MSPAGLARLSTEGRWKCYPYLELLNRRLLDLAYGSITWLLVDMPPRHGKSTLVSRFFPPWFTGVFPDKRVLLASYESNFASSWGLMAKDEAEKFGPSLFGVKVRRDVSAASNWRYQGREGGMSTAGVGGPFTGKGGDILVVDDPLKNAEEARSAARRNLIWDWFTTVALTRLEPGGGVVVVQTRWNEDDLVGRIKREFANEPMVELNFAALAEEGDPLGREKGEALCPERFNQAALERIRSRMSPYWWASLYQQKPRPEEGNVFKESWFPRFRGDAEGMLIRRSLILDSAHKTKKENDYSAIAVEELRAGGIFLRYVWRDRVTYPDLKKKAVALFRTWAADEICIEDKDVGAALIQELQRETSLPVIPLAADRDKVARANAATPMCEAGRVFIPEDKSTAWIEPFMSELLSFPAGANDDQVDVFVHGINRLKNLGQFIPDIDSIMVETGYHSIGANPDWESPR